MTTIELSRTGNCPLEFQGEELARVSTRRSHTEATRWHELTAYAAADGAYVLHVSYRSDWLGEPERDDVLVGESLEAAAGWIASAAALADVLPGYELADDDRRDRLERDLTRRLSAAAERLVKAGRTAMDREPFRRALFAAPARVAAQAEEVG